MADTCSWQAMATCSGGLGTRLGHAVSEGHLQCVSLSITHLHHSLPSLISITHLHHSFPTGGLLAYSLAMRCLLYGLALTHHASAHLTGTGVHGYMAWPVASATSSAWRPCTCRYTQQLELNMSACVCVCVWGGACYSPGCGFQCTLP